MKRIKVKTHWRSVFHKKLNYLRTFLQPSLPLISGTVLCIYPHLPVPLNRSRSVADWGPQPLIISIGLSDLEMLIRRAITRNTKYVERRGEQLLSRNTEQRPMDGWIDTYFLGPPKNLSQQPPRLQFWSVGDLYSIGPWEHRSINRHVARSVAYVHLSYRNLRNGLH